MSEPKAVIYPEFEALIKACARYDANGTEIESDGRVYVSDSIPLALGGSGDPEEIKAMARSVFAAAETALSVDETLSTLAALLREISDEQRYATPLMVAVGAISETRGPISLVFCTYRRPGGLEPFELHDARSVAANAGSVAA